MEGFRKLESQELPAFARIAVNAYPGMRIASDEDIQKYVERMRKHEELDPRIDYYGLFRSSALLGGFCMYNFDMNLLGVRAKAGGIGTLAVDLLHKKEKVARDTVLATLEHFRDGGTNMVLLYPFRPDFYRKMGFGYGTKMNRYSLRPADLPNGRSKEHVVYLGSDDITGIHACYERYFERTHGMMGKPAGEMVRMFDNPQIKVVGCKRDSNITGYMVFSFRQDAHGRFMSNDLLVRELVYDTRADLAELMTFLHSQADQIRKVVIDTQDESFHFLPTDPRDGSDDVIPSVYHVTNAQGVGLMYRVVDVAGIFGILRSHNFGSETCKVRFAVEDSLLPQNNGSTVVHFEAGQPTLKGDCYDWEVGVKMPVAEFSSLLVGAVDFTSLYTYGLADISNEKHLSTIDRLFKAPKPVCLTAF